MLPKHTETQTQPGAEKSTPARREKLAFTIPELCAELSIQRTTLYRLEQRGLLRSVPGIARNKIYSAAEVRRFLSGENAEKLMGGPN